MTYSFSTKPGAGRSETIPTTRDLTGYTLTAEFSVDSSFSSVTTKNVTGSGKNVSLVLTAADVDSLKDRYYRIKAVKGGVTSYIQSGVVDYVVPSPTLGEQVIADPALRAAFETFIRPEQFGAKGDWTDTTPTLGTGTDDTAAFQSAVDYAIANDAKGLLLTSKYRIDGTVYINPPAGMPSAQMPTFTLAGLDGHPSSSRGRGCAIVRTAPGDVFRVNCDSSGNMVGASDEQWTGFAASGFSFIGKSVTEGAIVNGRVGFRMFRTRGAMRNLHASRFDYLIDQPEFDTSGDENYCDLATYENFHIEKSTLSGLRLCRPDAGRIDGIFFEGPLPTAVHGIELLYPAGTTVANILHWADPSQTYSPVAGSSFILVSRGRSTRIAGLHLERNLPFLTTLDVFGSIGTTVEDAYSTFTSNTFLTNRNSSGTRIAGWYSNETRQAGTYDIDVQGNPGNNRDITWERVYLEDPITDGVFRTLLLNGTPGISVDKRNPALLVSGEATIPRYAAQTRVTMSSGLLRLAYFTAEKTEVITNLRIMSSVGAAATPTLVRLGVYSVAANGDLTLLAATANDTSLLVGNTTSFTRSLTSSWTKIRGQRYALGVILVSGAAGGSVAGALIEGDSTEVGVPPRIVGLLTAQTDLPASIAAASVANSTGLPYIAAAP